MTVTVRSSLCWTAATLQPRLTLQIPRGRVAGVQIERWPDGGFSQEVVTRPVRLNCHTHCSLQCGQHTDVDTPVMQPSGVCDNRSAAAVLPLALSSNAQVCMPACNSPA